MGMISITVGKLLFTFQLFKIQFSFGLSMMFLYAALITN